MEVNGDWFWSQPPVVIQVTATFLTFALISTVKNDFFLIITSWAPSPSQAELWVTWL